MNDELHIDRRVGSPSVSAVVEYNFGTMDTRTELSDPQTHAVFGTDWGDDYAGSAGHERLRTRGRRRLPELLDVATERRNR
jgi:hypothetical protein